MNECSDAHKCKRLIHCNTITIISGCEMKVQKILSHWLPFSCSGDWMFPYDFLSGPEFGNGHTFDIGILRILSTNGIYKDNVIDNSHWSLDLKATFCSCIKRLSPIVTSHSNGCRHADGGGGKGEINPVVLVITYTCSYSASQ